MKRTRSSSSLALVAGLGLGLLGAPSSAWAEPAVREVQGLPSLAPLVDSVKSAVVNVEVVSRAGREEGGAEGGGNDFFDQFFGQRGMQNPHPQQLRQGLGSGFVIDSKGYVLTNNHVVEGSQSIRVRFDDGRSFDGEVMGRDPSTDVALIKLRGNVGTLPSLKLGDSDAMRVGDWVVAIGNPFGLASSVSAGIISARARDIQATAYDDFLQTDAAINPGNSGGPLFNLKGEVIGINTAIVQGGSGIGFAVPSNLVKALVPQLERSGSVTRGYMGVGTQKLTPEIAKALAIPVNQGALVFSIESNSPAAKAGLKRDDTIVAIDGQKIVSDAALRRVVALKAPGQSTTVDIYRGGKPEKLKMLLVKRPEEAKGRAGEHTGPVNLDEEPSSSKQRIGLNLQDWDVDPRLAQANGVSAQGVVITNVAPGSAADRADLDKGQIIVEANGKPARSKLELWRIIRGGKPGQTILFRIQAQGMVGSQVRVLTIPGGN